MIILKKNNHIDETKLDRNESILFIELLKVELKRHRYQVSLCEDKTYFEFNDINSIDYIFWKCQEENHKIDCEKIERCICYLIKKWGIL